MVNVRHLAATPVGATVTARAELLAADGRRLTFNVTAHDGTDLIGEGTHERALIDLARFEAKVQAKAIGYKLSEKDGCQVWRARCFAP
jgi:fluoroacetyl-CoA thioesterase